MGLNSAELRKLIAENRRQQLARVKKPDRAIASACASALTTVLFAAAGIALLSRRPSKSFLIEASCDEVQTDQGVTLKIDPAISSVYLSNFQGGIAHVDMIQLPGEPKPRVFPSGREIQFKATQSDPTDAPPSLRLNRVGIPAPMMVQVQEKLVILTASAQQGSDQIKLDVGAQSTVAGQAQRFRIEQARYHRDKVLREYKSDGDLPTFEVASSLALVEGRFEAPAYDNSEASTIAFIFPSSSGRILLLDRARDPIQFGQAGLGLSRCKSAFLQIEGGPDLTVRNDQNDEVSAFTVQSSEFRLHHLFVTERNQKGVRFLSLKGTGLSSSILRDQKQLVPTFLEDILGKKPYEVGLTGAALLFFVFAGAIFLKRSLEVLAKRCIPD